MRESCQRKQDGVLLRYLIHRLHRLSLEDAEEKGYLYGDHSFGSLCSCCRASGTASVVAGLRTRGREVATGAVFAFLAGALWAQRPVVCLAIAGVMGAKRDAEVGAPFGQFDLLSIPAPSVRGLVVRARIQRPYLVPYGGAGRPAGVCAVHALASATHGGSPSRV